MRTAEAVTPMPGLGITFALFTALYIGLAIAVAFLMWRQIVKTGVSPQLSTMTGELAIPRGISEAAPRP